MSENHPNGPSQPSNENWDEEPTRVVNDSASGYPAANSSPQAAPGYQSAQPSWQQDPRASGSPNGYGQPGYQQTGAPYTPAPGTYPSQGNYQQPSYGSQPPAWGSGNQPGAYGTQQPPAWGGANQQNNGTYGSQPLQPGGSNPWAAPGSNSNAYAANPAWYGPSGNMPGTGQYANWGKRVGSYFIDGLILIPFNVLTPFAMPRYVHYEGTNITRQTGGSWAAIIALMFFAMVVVFINTCVLQGRSGQSLGKRALGIRLISERTGQPLGILRCFLRQLAHIVDCIPFYVGFLWPLWDAKRQTFADKIMRSVVVDDPRR